MAKITFTADDGSVQEFDVTIPATPAPAAPTITEVDVKESDGSEVVATPTPNLGAVVEPAPVDTPTA